MLIENPAARAAKHHSLASEAAIADRDQEAGFHYAIAAELYEMLGEHSLSKIMRQCAEICAPDRFSLAGTAE